MHEVKWFALYHSPAAIKQLEISPGPWAQGQEKSGQVRPRGNQAGDRKWGSSSPLLLSLQPSLGVCFLQQSIWGEAVMQKMEEKEGLHVGSADRQQGKASVLLDVWTVNSLAGRAWRKCLEKKKEETLGTMEGALRGHRDALWIPKAAGLKSTSPPKYSIWPFVVLAQQLENRRRMSQTLLHDEHESLHPTQPPYIWPQEALMDCSHPPHFYDVPAGKGVAQRVGGGVTRSKLLRED